MRLKIALSAVLATAVALVAWTLSGATPHAAAYAVQCSSPDHSPRSAVNPLDTPNFSGTDPLTKAHLFVESPWDGGGEAANAIANEVGLHELTVNYRLTPIPWAQFKARVNAMHLSPAVGYRVHELEKIANFPQSHRFTMYTSGGTGPNIYSKVQNYLCRMQRTTPGSVADITTYFLQHTGCASGDQPNFRAEVDALKAAVGDFPALILVEEDAVDTVCWRSSAAVTGREAMLKYEIDQLSQLPHALLYVEGGTSDADTPQQAAQILNAADASKTRGFFTNDTHYNWAANEIAYGDKVAALTHGLHFVVDTRADGQGPILNPDPVHQGIEELCNPPARGLGPKPGASNGASYGMYSKYLDGFVWVNPPHSSAATCPGRTGTWAASGLFDEGIAVDYGHHANDRIGPSPRYPSRPY